MRHRFEDGGDDNCVDVVIEELLNMNITIMGIGENIVGSYDIIIALGIGILRSEVIEWLVELKSRMNVPLIGLSTDLEDQMHAYTLNLEPFDHLSTKFKGDLRILSSVLGTSRVSYIPDLVLWMNIECKNMLVVSDRYRDTIIALSRGCDVTLNGGSRALDLLSDEIAGDRDSYIEGCRGILRSGKIRGIVNKVLVSRWGEDIIEEVVEDVQGSGSKAMVSLCYVTGSPDSDYTYGLEERLEEGIPLGDLLRWIRKDNDSRHVRGFNLSYMEQDIMNGIHRSGWNYCIGGLKSIETKNGILLDTYCDRTFLWSRRAMEHTGVIPYTTDWYGFFHHTFDDSFTDNNLGVLFETKSFIQSLPTCRGIIVLSEYLAKKIRNIFPKVNVRVLYHPTSFTLNGGPLPLFSSNELEGLVSIGSWYRNPFSLYHIDVPSLRRTHLEGKNMSESFPPNCYTICSKKPLDNRHNKFLVYMREHIVDNVGEDEEWIIRVNGGDVKIETENSMIRRFLEQLTVSMSGVKHENTLTNEEYDNLLAHNAVFLNLVDCSACNTLIECIARNTPIIINRHPAVVEYIGESYPLLYDSLGEVPLLCSDDNIKKGCVYLQSMDKTFLTLDAFVHGMSMLL